MRQTRLHAWVHFRIWPSSQLTHFSKSSVGKLKSLLWFLWRDQFLHFGDTYMFKSMDVWIYFMGEDQSQSFNFPLVVCSCYSLFICTFIFLWNTLKFDYLGHTFQTILSSIRHSCSHIAGLWENRKALKLSLLACKLDQMSL